MHTPMVSIVIPCYNEESVIGVTLTTLCERLEEYQLHNYEIIVVDDGSSDSSLEELTIQAEKNKKIKAVALAANRGQQIALYAGMCYAAGDVTILMDADLQDPPECIPEMIKLWQQGYHVVYGKRKYRDGETVFKRISAYLFYRLLDKLSYAKTPVDVGEFRLMDRCIVDIITQIGEYHRFNRALVSWIGFKQIELVFERPSRFGGQTKYDMRALLSLGMDGFFSFSNVPIYFIQSVGGISVIVSLCLIIYTLLSWAFGYSNSGWASLMIVVTLLFGISLFSIGIIGEYILRIFQQVSDRPIFVPMKTINLKNAKIPAVIDRFVSRSNKDLN